MAVAFSGGLDSSFLLRVAVDTLGKDNVLAATAQADNFPAWEADEANALARELGCRRLDIPFDPLSVRDFAANEPERCSHCKRALFAKLVEEAKREGFAVVADGTNTDDMSDYRPGLKAIRELGIASPLLLAGMGKGEIRRLGREMGLEFWDKPSFACLASRFPQGEPITAEKMARVERAELYFLGLGFKNIRVRSHGDLARIEVDPADRKLFFDNDVLDNANTELKRLGFAYATLDMGGYRMGSMNRTDSIK